MVQKPYKRRLFYIELVTLISGASLVDFASAQYSNSYFSGANQASSTVVVSDHSAGSGNGELAPPKAAPVAGISNRQAVVDGPAASASFSVTRLNGPGERSSLEMIAPQAQAHNNYALKLAERGAVQSAQAEFTMALDLIADALDADTNNATRAHARAVQAGLTAIEETKDFVPADTPHDIEINLVQLAATHQTPVLKNIDTTRMTRAEALQRYHMFATQQLAFAGGRSAIASSALYGLGRAKSLTATGASTVNPLGAPNAMALFQAALLIDSENYMASNELGVLMARYGDLDSAEGQLMHSLAIKPQVETWHNLATVYRRMGQLEKAEQAEKEREKLLVAARNRGVVTENSTDLGLRPAMQWVDVDTFAASGTPYGFDGPAVNSNKPASVAQRDSLGKRLISKLIPWPKADTPQQTADPTKLDDKTEPSRGADSDGRSLFK